MGLDPLHHGIGTSSPSVNRQTRLKALPSRNIWMRLAPSCIQCSPSKCESVVLEEDPRLIKSLFPYCFVAPFKFQQNKDLIRQKDRITGFRIFSDPCESNPCGSAFVCSYSSTPVNGNYYICGGTVSLYGSVVCLLKYYK